MLCKCLLLIRGSNESPTNFIWWILYFLVNSIKDVTSRNRSFMDQ